MAFNKGKHLHVLEDGDSAVEENNIKLRSASKLSADDLLCEILKSRLKTFLVVHHIYLALA